MCPHLIRINIMHGRSPGQRYQPGGYFTQHYERQLLSNFYFYPHWDLIVKHSWGVDFETTAHSRWYQIVNGFDKLVKFIHK